MNEKTSIKKYIFLLAILLILYYLVGYFPGYTKSKRDREIEVASNISELRQTTGELDKLIQADKDSLNDFFYNNKTYSKIDGLIKSNPSDLELKINDNLKVFLKKEEYPVRVRYKRAEYDFIDSRVSVSEDKNIALIKDVKVIKNPNGINENILIHDLKTYLVDAYGQISFDKLLDETIEEQVEENKNLIKELSSKTN